VAVVLGGERGVHVEVVGVLEDAGAESVVREVPRRAGCLGVVPDVGFELLVCDVGPGEVERDGHRRQAEERRLDGRRDGPRAPEDVVAEVRPPVAARDHEVRIERERPDPGDDAVGRRPVDDVSELVFLDGDPPGEPSTDRALVLFRGHDRDVGERRECLVEGVDTRRGYPVVVGEEDVHAVRWGGRRKSPPGRHTLTHRLRRGQRF